MSIEHIIDYYDGVATAARNPLAVEAAAYAHGLRVRVPEEVQRWHASARYCAGCSQRIAANVRHVVVGAEVFHPSCSERHRAKHQQQEQPRAPRVIGCISGRAAPLGQWGTIRTRDGESFESIAPGAFDLTRGVQLQVGHNNSPIPGSMLLSTARDWSGLWLTFDFLVRDSSYGRDVLRRMASGECHGCSIGFRDQVRRWDSRARGDVIASARLVEVSLCFDRQPAWYGTHARAY